MSAGFPDAKPCASCWPRSEATMTLTWIPVRFDQACAALLTAKVSAGPELPINAVIVVALVLAVEPRAAPTATASAPTVTTANVRRQRATGVVRCACTSSVPPCGCLGGSGRGTVSRGESRAGWDQVSRGFLAPQRPVVLERV